MRIKAINHNLFHNTNTFKAKSVKSTETASIKNNNTNATNQKSAKSIETVPISNTVTISKEEAQTVLQKGDEVISSVKYIQQMAKLNYLNAIDVLATFNGSKTMPPAIEQGEYKLDNNGQLKEFSTTLAANDTKYHFEYLNAKPHRITLQYSDDKKDVFIFNRQGKLTSVILGASTPKNDKSGRIEETDFVYGFCDDETLRAYSEKSKVTTHQGYEITSDTETKYEMRFKIGENNTPYLENCKANRWTHHGTRVSFDKYKEYKFDKDRNLIS